MGTEYIVTETDYTADGYVANIKTYTGTITGAETLRLPFVNTYQPQGALGSLRITKEVGGENPDPDKVFTFAVGARMLYSGTDLDILKNYMEYIKKELIE